MKDTQPGAPAPGTIRREKEDFPVIPNFPIVKVLGEGGMGKVYLAKQIDASYRFVAVKTIHAEFAHKEGFRRRFLKESANLAALDHQNILTLVCTGAIEDCLYIVTLYASGGSLADRIRDGALSERARLDIIRQLADALKYLHERDVPIIHMDVKPANVLFSNNVSLLADFGISKELIDQTLERQPGTRAFDVQYCSPEQLSGLPTTASDIFSLGKVLFELLAGKRPDVSCVQSDKNRAELIEELEPRFRKYGPLIARCLAYNPSERPTAAELCYEIDVITTPPPGFPWRKVAAAALVVALGMSTIIPSVQEKALEIWYLIFPPDTFEVRFSLEPPVGRIWVDGREAPFRPVELTEGVHSVAAVADNFVGEYRSVTVPVASGSPDTRFSLERRPPITDEEYWDFQKWFGMEATGNTDASPRIWVDATLANLTSLDLLYDDDNSAFDARVAGLKVLAAAGDPVAQTTLFYAAFEEVPVGSQPVQLLKDLDMASAKGYALATVLRALYTLDEVRSQGKSMVEIDEAEAQLMILIDRIASQGMPQTAEKLREVIALWKQSTPAAS